MRVGIVGAGVAGLVTAKVLTEVGHDVVVYDRTPDVGGVWSATRRYPGLSTQSPRDTYTFADFPMSPDLPEWPSGEQVQAYLANFSGNQILVGEFLRWLTRTGVKMNRAAADLSARYMDVAAVVL